MLRNLSDGTVVSHHESVPTPLLAQHVVYQPAVGRSRCVIHNVKRCHHRPRSSLGRSLVGREELVVHPDVAHIYRVIVAPSLCTAIQRIVLHAGHHVLGPVVALIAPHQSLCDARTQIRILAIALSDAPPSGIQGDIHHRTVRPADTISRRLFGRYPGRLLDGLQIPAARHAQRDGEDRLVAMNHVHTHQQGDTQPALFYGCILKRTDTLHTLLV